MKTEHRGIYMRKSEKVFHPIKGKSVYIIFHGNALGDTLAFFPYVEQFRIENKSKVKVYLPKQEMIQFLFMNYTYSLSKTSSKIDSKNYSFWHTK